MSKLSTAAQDLLALITDNDDNTPIVEAYKNACGSDAWDDWNMVETTFLDVLKDLAKGPMP